MTSNSDIDYMRHALSLARRGLGRVAPNPSVGCVIVKGGVVVGTGWTRDGGRPHAETEAIKQAGGETKGAMAYVSLEPCAHEGETPSCAKSLVEAGLKRVVVACEDPDPRTAGQGIQILKDAGIEVNTGVLEKEAQDLNAGFFLRVKENRPFVTLKLAISSDSKIAVEGARTQISGELAQRHTHLIRSQHDAILVGANTARVDKPKLTTRIDGYNHNSKRFVLGDVGDTDLTPITEVDTRDIKAVLAYLAGQGITRLLVEGGAQTHVSFLEAGYCDRFLLFKSPEPIGAQGVEALYGHDIGKIEAEFALKQQKTMSLGQDLLEIYGKAA